jgi:hypothetical protein
MIKEGFSEEEGEKRKKGEKHGINARQDIEPSNLSPWVSRL